MARSVVLNQTPRCPRCQLPPRWCLCAKLVEVECPFRLDVLAHFMEDYRPSSTGHLINRVIPAAGRHIFRRREDLARGDLAQAGKELWILHPNGELPPPNVRAGDVQVVLLDGTWTQAAGMARAVGGWGRRVQLPMEGASRYWLRAQSGPDRFSTVEALLFLLAELGLERAHRQLRLQFEMHVFANLCARGQRSLAVEYLVDSPLTEAVPDLIERLTRSRRHDAHTDSRD